MSLRVFRARCNRFDILVLSEAAAFEERSKRINFRSLPPRAAPPAQVTNSFQKLWPIAVIYLCSTPACRSASGSEHNNVAANRRAPFLYSSPLADGSPKIACTPQAPLPFVITPTCSLPIHCTWSRTTLESDVTSMCKGLFAARACNPPFMKSSPLHL